MHPSPTRRGARGLRGLAAGEFEQGHRVRAFTGVHVEHEQTRALSRGDRHVGVRPSGPPPAYARPVGGRLQEAVRREGPLSSRLAREDGNAPSGVEERTPEQLAGVPCDAPAWPRSVARAAPPGPLRALGLPRPLCVTIASFSHNARHHSRSSPIRGRADLSPTPRSRGCPVSQGTRAGDGPPDGDSRPELPTRAREGAPDSERTPEAAAQIGACPGVGAVGSRAPRGARANPPRVARRSPRLRTDFAGRAWA